MSVEFVGILTVLIGIAVLFLPLYAGLAALTVSTLFGSAAAFILPGIGNVSPAHTLLGFLIFSLFRDPGRSHVVTQIFRGPPAAFCLSLTVTYGIFSSFFLPRLFAGALEVFPSSGSDGDLKVPLAPMNGNISQTAYFCAWLLCFLVVSYGVREKRSFRWVAGALLVYGGADILFAILDVATARTGTANLLSFIRNATYTVYASTEGGASNRIIGSFTEASAFSYATIGVFCYSARLWLGGRSQAAALPVALASALLLVLSTSSTALVALGICVPVLYLGSLCRLASGDATRGDAQLVFVAPCLAIVALAVILLNSELSAWIWDLLDGAIFRKGLSESALQRGLLNEQALEVFTATSGIGVGLGSERASSFALACLANLGIVGSLLYGFFIIYCICPKVRQNSSHDEVRAAASYACFGLVVGASIAGASVDLGLPFAVFAAIACTSPLRPFATWVFATNHASKLRFSPA